ncbi:MAG: hypothetical protein JWP31_1910 [Aeromicrobium sp.]|nr:hypothetical protein [Aeromicrobium sp.]
MYVVSKPVPPARSRPGLSIAQVQRWVISALIGSVSMFPLGALTVAVHSRADRDTSGAVILTVMTGVIGISAAVAIRLVHQRSPWSPWLALGVVVAIGSAVWTWGFD